MNKWMNDDLFSLIYEKEKITGICFREPVEM